MALLTFNKRLGWVVAGCVAWSLIGLAIAAGGGAGRHPGVEPPFRISMGLAQNSIIVDGQLLSITESEDKLAISVNARPDGKQQAYHPGGEVLSELPGNLEITFTSGERRPGPPTISLLSGANRAQELAPKRWGLLTENYALKFAPGHLRIIPKPADAKPGWWRRYVQQEPGGQERLRRPGGEFREGRPGGGQPRGDGPRKPPPSDKGGRRETP